MRYEVLTRGSLAKSPLFSEDTLKLRLNDDIFRPDSKIEFDTSTVFEILLPNCVRLDSESGRSLDPKIISESDIDPVEYFDVSKACFAALAR